MFLSDKPKIDKEKLTKTIQSFRMDYNQIMGRGDGKRLNATGGEGTQLQTENFTNAPTGWMLEFLPPHIVKVIGAIPEKVAYFLACKEFTAAEKESVKSFFDVNQEIIERRLRIFEKLINFYFPDIASKAQKLSEDPHWELLFEMLNPYNAYKHAKEHIQEQRIANNYVDEKAVA